MRGRKKVFKQDSNDRNAELRNTDKDRKNKVKEMKKNEDSGN